MRMNVFLVCEKCKSRNYITSRKKESTKKLALKKYCPKCKAHTLHKEAKVK